jgi:hypothetical protein
MTDGVVEIVEIPYSRGRESLQLKVEREEEGVPVDGLKTNNYSIIKLLYFTPLLIIISNNS